MKYWWIFLILIAVGGAIAIYFILSKSSSSSGTQPVSGSCEELKKIYTDEFLNKGGVGMGCYKGTGTYDNQPYSAEQAIAWFNPTKAPCSRSGSNCNGTTKRQCEDTIDKINQVINQMRATCK